MAHPTSGPARRGVPLNFIAHSSAWPVWLSGSTDSLSHPSVGSIRNHGPSGVPKVYLGSVPRAFPLLCLQKELPGVTGSFACPASRSSRHPALRGAGAPRNFLARRMASTVRSLGSACTLSQFAASRMRLFGPCVSCPCLSLRPTQLSSANDSLTLSTVGSIRFRGPTGFCSVRRLRLPTALKPGVSACRARPGAGGPGVDQVSLRM